MFVIFESSSCQVVIRRPTPSVHSAHPKVVRLKGGCLSPRITLPNDFLVGPHDTLIVDPRFALGSLGWVRQFVLVEEKVPADLSKIDEFHVPSSLMVGLVLRTNLETQSSNPR